MSIKKRIPVTVITGFLGSGKTTLLNRILTENHGKRIAVIENEFGEIGIDQELVIREKEEIFEMNNGCICCTVRGDLLRIIKKLIKDKKKFDHIIIETTGLADPAPVAQTFLTDQELYENTVIDSIITIVDAKHISLHIDSSPEAKEQIAFADIILLNKIDLIKEVEVSKLEEKIKSINKFAKIYRTENTQIDISKLLDVGSFDLEKVKEVDPSFLEIEYPFEYGAIYKLKLGEYDLLFDKGPDESMKIFFSKFSEATEEYLQKALNAVAITFSADPKERKENSILEASLDLNKLILNEKTKFTLSIKEEGFYSFFTEHHPDEFNIRLLAEDSREIKPEVESAFKPNHSHDDEVSSVGIQVTGEVDPDKLNKWLSYLLRNIGEDIYRFKGVLSVKGEKRRYVFQGVHMLFDSVTDREWAEGEEKKSIFVFIGRNLDRNILTQGFLSCKSN